MADYQLRAATLEDAETIVHHRIAMFEDMGLTFDRDAVAGAFRPWLRGLMAEELYKAWLVDCDGTTVAGGGFAIIPWPPGPNYPGSRLAFVYNVYTEPAHRHRGLARLVMAAIHHWCRNEGIGSIALNASEFGRPLYESMGYRVTTSPMMYLSLESAQV